MKRNWMGATSAELSEAFRAGRRDVLERLYLEHVIEIERLVGATLRRARRFSPTDVADIVQDAFAKAFSPRSRAAYDGERQYGPFLRKIAKNTAIDWLRRNQHHALRHVELTQALDAPELTTGVEEDTSSQEMLTAVQRYVVGLEPELKAIHERRFLAADSQEAAARTLGISRQTLRTLERRLLAGLRRELCFIDWSESVRWSPMGRRAAAVRHDRTPAPTPISEPA
jgi:RNA polymerase sigma factor (sigma-70 family)